MAKLLLALFATLLCSGPMERAEAGSAGNRIVIGYAAVNARVCPLWAAKEQGFFAKYNIDADPIFIRTAPTLVAALSSGDINLGYTGGTAVVGADAGGADLKVLASFTNRVTYDLVVRPGIKSIEDLKGKRFGVQSIGGTVWMGAILGLEHLGLDPSRDGITMLAVGDQGVLAQAVASGAIDATVVDGVQSRRLHENGLPILAEFNKINLPILSVAIVARASYIQRSPVVLENILRSVLEGAAFCMSPAEKATTLKLLQKKLRVDERAAEEGYKDMLIGFDRKPYPSPEAVRNIRRLMKLRNPKVEKVKVENLIDDRILRHLDQSGFIDEMYAKYGVR